MRTDVKEILPEEVDGKKIVIKEIGYGKLEIYMQVSAPGRGHDSKKIAVNRFIELDNLFFEGLGLWQGEGGKSKGLYFGNSCPELLLRFLEFVEEKLGMSRKDFKVTVNVPELKEAEDAVRKKWSNILKIPVENFTNICVDERMNREYAQFYINSIVLVELMKNMHEKLKTIISSRRDFTNAYLRGAFAAEGSVVLKPWGTIVKIDFATIDMGWVEFLKKCLIQLKILPGAYVRKGKKFQIYGKRNFEKVKELKFYDLHPDKKEKFERGFGNYQRDIMKGSEMEKLILQQLSNGPKTYDELSGALKKGRSTIQSHYIPILEKKSLIKREGKRKQAWLFAITKAGLLTQSAG